MRLLRRMSVGQSGGRHRSFAAPNSQRAAETRNEILEVAADEFARNGYVATTVDQIANRMGFTKPALYYYFPNKYAILIALFDRMISEYFENAYRMAQSKLSPIEKLRRLLDDHIDFVTTRTNWTIVFTNEEVHLDVEQRKVVRRRRRTYDQLLQNIYEEGVRAGVFEDAHSYTVIAGLIGLATSLSIWYRPEGRITPSQVKEIYWNLLSRGFLADGSQKAGLVTSNRSQRRKSRENAK